MTTTAAEAPAVELPSRRQWGLRRRILLIFTLGALMLSVLLATITYGIARSNLMQQRESDAEQSAESNASIAYTVLRGQPNAQPAIDRLGDTGVDRAVVWYNDEFRGALNTEIDETNLPEQLVADVTDDLADSKMIVEVDDELHLVVGYSLPLARSAAYFEFFSLDDVDQTLRSVRLSLILGGLITTALGVAAGVFAARRAVRPLGVAATAAKAIAGGRLDTRLEPTDDPDLSVLANSFNDMATALQTRIERDTRFASDVSHELRSPLMTLSASVEVMNARRDDMPERAQAALDLLKSDVTRFQGLVEDLLEISRFDAGAIRLNTDELLVAEFVRQAVAVSSKPDTPILVAPRAEMLLIEGDRRRLARVIANLIDNACLHGGGEPELSIIDVGADDGPVTQVRIAVEDHGEGVPVDERERIFERFSRGGIAGRRTANDGAGLGLSLVAEHVRLHGGRVWVEDRLDGQPGARFVVELDAEPIDLDDGDDGEFA